MSNQYHFEQESSLSESPVNQAVKFFTRDWETTNDQIDSFSDPLEGKIIAQMPDLGECRTISEVRRSQQQQSANWLNRIYSGFTHGFAYGFAVISHFPKRLRQILPSIKFRNFQLSFIRQRKFYSNLIIICLVILIIGGGVLIYKGNKKKWKEVAHRDVDQNIVQVEEVKTPEATPTPVENPTTPPPTPSTEKPAPTPPPTPSTEKPAPTPPPTPSTEKPAPTPPPTPSTEKPAPTPPPTPSTEKPPTTVPAATVAVITPNVSETKNKDQNDVNSPWERSTTDNYSPWAINSQSRLEAVGSEAAGTSTTSVNPVQPTTNPSVPLLPMTPLAPNQPEMPANTAINNSNNNNLANPVNNTVPVANNVVPPVNNVVPVVNNPAPPVNNVVPPVSVAQHGLPHPPNVNGIVTVYSQHNIPVSQDYMATYGRTNIPSVPAPMQPPQQPIYPPQIYNGQPVNGQVVNGQPVNGQLINGQAVNGQLINGQVVNGQPINGQAINGQPLQNQFGQYQQIVPPTYLGTPTVNNITQPVPMHGVAPQPQPIPMAGTAPIPIQPIAPVQGTASLPIPQEIISPSAIPIPAGMVPPAGTMPMYQPIPTQVTTSIPPTYRSSSTYSPYPVPSANIPVSPSYYPPTVVVPYYQQGNTNTSVPYRRLY